MRATSQTSEESIDLAVTVFGMLADATRVRILLALGAGETTVSALAAAVERPVPAVSQHLAKLRLARMVTTRQEGTHVHYRLADDHAIELIDTAIHQARHMLGVAPAHRATIEQSNAQHHA